jgi:hypothetical protein
LRWPLAQAGVRLPDLCDRSSCLNFSSRWNYRCASLHLACLLLLHVFKSWNLILYTYYCNISFK